MLKQTLPILLFSILGISCSKKCLLYSDYFVFGATNGECVDDCAEFYLMQDRKIYPDELTSYKNELKFINEALPKETFLLAKGLEKEFPVYLLENYKVTYGCPDCLGQGGLHIEIRKNDEIRRWHFDLDEKYHPEEVKDYIKKVKQVLEQL
jgi:hypothetical protein